MIRKAGYLLLVFTFISIPVLAACSQDNTDNEPSPNTTTPTAAITDAEKEGIVYIYELEKLARDVYKALYDQWETPVLNVISGSEQSHMDIMGELIDKYSLDNPAAAKAGGDYTTSELQEMYDDLVEQGSASEIDALLTAAAIEELDILDIEESLAKTEKHDIASAFEILIEGSENHLGIFSAKLEEQGVEYQPQYLSQAEYDRIISTVTVPTATGTPTAATFGELAVKGKISYNGNCFNCHGNSLSTGSSSTAILSSYQNAQRLLTQISTMPTRGPQDEWEVLSYLLLEHEWVSGDAVFSQETLDEIPLTP